MPAKRSFRHIESLDGVRGIAVLVVVFHHLAFISLPTGPWNPAVRYFSDLFRYGALGVDLFFVLSGYLITTLLLIDRRDPNGYWNFYIKRAFRIVPVLLVSLAFGRSTGFLTTSTTVLSLVFLANYARLGHLPTEGGYWSLSVEEQFYLAWPIAIRCLRFERFLWLIAFVIAVEPFMRFLMNMNGHGTAYFTFVRCDGLAWGAMLGSLAYYNRIYASEKRAIAWWRRSGHRFLAIGSLLSVIMIAIFSYRNLGFQQNTIILTVVPLLFTGVVAHLICHPSSIASRTLSWRPLRFFGEISYALYLFHLNVMFVYDRYRTVQPGDDVAYFSRILIVFVISTVLCALSLYCLERPIMRLRSRYLRSSRRVS